MKKISILSLHLGYGGIEKSIVALANLLAKDYEVEIACTYHLYDKPAFNMDRRVRVKYLTDHVAPNKDDFKNALHKKNPISILREGFKSIGILRLRRNTMKRYIQNCHSDIIISTRDIFDDWLGKYAPKGVLKIGWEHNHFHGNFKYAKKLIRYASKLNYFVLVSNELKEYYGSELKNTNCKCVYIPNIIDKLPKYPSHLNKKKLVSVGRLSEEKGFMDLLQVYHGLTTLYPDWKLDIIGDGAERPKLEEYIRANKLTKNVTLHGFRNKDYIDEILHSSSIYLMTSHTESFGIVLIEAMSHGVPCIAYDSAEGARELIRNGENGYLVANRNKDEYIHKIVELIENKELRDKMGKVAYDSVLPYTGEEVIKLWHEILKG